MTGSRLSWAKPRTTTSRTVPNSLPALLDTDVEFNLMSAGASLDTTIGFTVDARMWSHFDIAAIYVTEHPKPATAEQLKSGHGT
jgi:hypothetical protein